MLQCLKFDAKIMALKFFNFQINLILHLLIKVTLIFKKWIKTFVPA